jgi:hypothetical protein
LAAAKATSSVLCAVVVPTRGKPQETESRVSRVSTSSLVNGRDASFTRLEVVKRQSISFARQARLAVLSIPASYP